MKKLSLKNLKLEASDMLQRDQLKTVFGGYSGNSESNKCQYIIKGNVTWGVSYAEAKQNYDAAVALEYSAGYCCASCATTSWAIK